MDKLELLLGKKIVNNIDSDSDSSSESDSDNKKRKKEKKEKKKKSKKEKKRRKKEKKDKKEKLQEKIKEKKKKVYDPVTQLNGGEDSDWEEVVADTDQIRQWMMDDMTKNVNKPTEAKRGPGDWTCIGCGNWNFVKREECFRCRVPKGKAKKAKPVTNFQFIPIQPIKKSS